MANTLLGTQRNRHILYIQGEMVLSWNYFFHSDKSIQAECNILEISGGPKQSGGPRVA